jgi:formylglycine-generating enzyme required for sulfatase activity
MVAVSKAAEKSARRNPAAEEKRPEPPQRSGDGAEMVSVPAGEFWMGSEESDAYAARYSLFTE